MKPLLHISYIIGKSIGVPRFYPFKTTLFVLYALTTKLKYSAIYNGKILYHLERSDFLPSVWTKETYSRLSVDRDVKQWCGWNNLKRYFTEIKNPLTRDVAVVEFSLMARVNEALSATSSLFRVEDSSILVTGLVLEKRWRKKGVELMCGECGSINQARAVQCASCGANLLVLGKKHFITEKIETVRIPFWFPKKEPQTKWLIDRLKKHDGLLFPELQGNNPRYGRRTAYNLLRETDRLAQKYLGVPHAWNHLFVALRGHCLGEEYDMDEIELKNFSSRVKSETVGKYVKKRLSYQRKMGIT